jgi:ABC-type uncharacterized transport system ATPase component
LAEAVRNTDVSLLHNSNSRNSLNHAADLPKCTWQQDYGTTSVLVIATRRVLSMKSLIIMTITMAMSIALAMGMEVVVAVVAGEVVEMMMKNSNRTKTARNEMCSSNEL